jgi:hypothetical protein
MSDTRRTRSPVIILFPIYTALYTLAHTINNLEAPTMAFIRFPLRQSRRLIRHSLVVDLLHCRRSSYPRLGARDTLEDTSETAAWVVGAYSIVRGLGARKRP